MLKLLFPVATQIIFVPDCATATMELFSNITTIYI